MSKEIPAFYHKMDHKGCSSRVLFQADLSKILNCEVHSKERKMGKKEKVKVMLRSRWLHYRMLWTLGLGATRWFPGAWEGGWGSQVKAGHQECPPKGSTIPLLAAFKADFQGMWTSSNPERIGHKPTKGRGGDNHVKTGRFCWSTSLEQKLHNRNYHWGNYTDI